MSKTSSQLYSLHGIYLPKSQHKMVRTLRRAGYEPSLHGNKVWRSSTVLMDYLLKHPPRKGARVMDIGCGWGALSSFMAVHFNARVTAVDADASLAPYVDMVTTLNGVSRVQFVPRRFEKITQKDLAGIHILVGSEICFWDEMTKPLYNLIRRALKAGVKQVLIADPGRPPFLNLVDMCEAKFNADMIGHTIKKPVKSEKFILRVKG